MKQIIIFPKGTLSPQDRQRMSKEGYVALEADDPQKVVMPMPTLQIQGDRLLLAALTSMGSDQAMATLHAKAAFVDQFIQILKEKKV